MASPGEHADGYRWFPIEWDDGVVGWSAQGDGAVDFFVTVSDVATPGYHEEPAGFEQPVPSLPEQAGERSGSAVDDPPRPTPEGRQADPPRADFAGVWTGVVHERQPSRNFVYPLVITFDSSEWPRIGTVAFPTLRGDAGRAFCFEAEEVGAVRVAMASGDCEPESVTSRWRLAFHQQPIAHMRREGDRYQASDVFSMSRQAELDAGLSEFTATLYRQSGGWSATSPEEVAERDEDRLRAARHATAWESIEERRAELLEQRAGARRMRDEGTGCEVAVPLDMSVSRVEWSGDCHDGQAHGSGSVEYFDEDGVWLWRHELTDERGITLVDGVQVVDYSEDAVKFEIPLANSGNCRGNRSNLQRHVVVTVSEELDASHPLLIQDLLEAATLLGKEMCLPEHEFRHVRAHVYIGNYTERDFHYSGFGHPIIVRDSLVTASNRHDDSLDLSISYSRRHAELSASLTQRREAELAQVRALQAREREAREAAARDREAQQRAQLVEEVRNLSASYYDVSVAMRPGRIDVLATLPASFPHATASGALALSCSDGAWTSPDERWLERFTGAEGVRLSPWQLSVRDVQISCSEDGKVTLASDTLSRTLGLITARPRAADVDLTQADARYYSIAFPRTAERERFVRPVPVTWTTDAVGEITMGNPSWWESDFPNWMRGRPFNELLIWRSNIVTVPSNFRGVVGVAQGASPLRPVMFEGEVTNRSFDPSTVLKVFVQSDVRAVWDYLELDVAGGRLTWWQSPEAPR